MATAKPYPEQGSRQPRRRWLARLALAGLALLLVALAFGWNQLSLRAVAAAAYAARVGCSCHFVADRDLGDCRKDFVKGLGPVQLSKDDAAHVVSARYLLFARQIARLQEGAGCVLEPWKGS